MTFKPRTLAVCAFAALLTSACDPLLPGPGDAEWRVMTTLSGQALAGVAGHGNGTAFAVGGRSPSDPPSFVVVDAGGVRTVTIPSGVNGVLRAVSVGASAGDPVVAVGDAGLVVRYDPGTGTLARINGVANDFDLRAITWHAGSFWIAGRQSVPSAEPPEAGVVFRFDGSTFTRESALPAGADVGGAFEAIFADPGGALWVAGTTGEILRRSGTTWQATPADNQRLLGLGGNGAIVVAVGGRTRATVLESASNLDFRDISPSGAGALLDVHVSSEGVVTAVGSEGSVWERRGSTWRTIPGSPLTASDAMGVHVDATGGIWVVGGHTSTTPWRDGFVWYYGAPQL